MYAKAERAVFHAKYGSFLFPCNPIAILQLEAGSQRTAYVPYRKPRVVPLMFTDGEAINPEGICDIKPTDVILSERPIRIEYVADTKTYIDNKIYEIAAAIVSNA